MTSTRRNVSGRECRRLRTHKCVWNVNGCGYKLFKIRKKTAENELQNKITLYR